MSLDINLTNVESTTNKKTTLTDNSDTFYPTQKAVKTAVDAKENTITAGTTAQYFRGDKTFQTLDKTAVGLSNVDNTSDANKPVSTATQTALNAKFNTPTGTTAQYLRGDGTVATFPTIPDTSDFVEKSDFTSHSILAKQSGASDPVAVSIGNNEILGRKSGGGSNIEGLSVSEVKSLLNYTASDVGAPSGSGTSSGTNTGDNIAIIGGSQFINSGTGGSERFIHPYTAGVGTQENVRQIVIPCSMVISKFFIQTGNSQPATGSHVLTLRKNGVDTSVQVTIPAGSASGVFSDTANSATFAAGDLLGIRMINNASTAAAQIQSMAFSN
jgi:hypothetical protein